MTGSQWLFSVLLMAALMALSMGVALVMAMDYGRVLAGATLAVACMAYVQGRDR